MKKHKKQTKSTFARYWQDLIKESVRRGPSLTFAATFVIAGTLGFVFYWFLLSGWLAENEVLRGTIEKKEADNMRGQAVEKSQQAFENEFRRLVELSDSAEPLLPNETELAQVLFGVQEIAKRQRVALTGLNASKDSQPSAIPYKDEKGEVKSADKVFEREIPAQVSGDYALVVRFFYDMARLSRIIVVKDFQLLASKNNQVTASFTLATFHAPPPDVIKKVAPLPPFLEKASVITPTVADSARN